VDLRRILFLDEMCLTYALCHQSFKHLYCSRLNVVSRSYRHMSQLMAVIFLCPSAVLGHKDLLVRCKTKICSYNWRRSISVFPSISTIANHAAIVVHAANLLSALY